MSNERVQAVLIDEAIREVVEKFPEGSYERKLWGEVVAGHLSEEEVVTYLVGLLKEAKSKELVTKQSLALFRRSYEGSEFYTYASARLDGWEGYQLVDLCEVVFAEGTVQPWYAGFKPAHIGLALGVLIISATVLWTVSNGSAKRSTATTKGVSTSKIASKGSESSSVRPKEKIKVKPLERSSTPSESNSGASNAQSRSSSAPVSSSASQTVASSTRSSSVPQGVQPPSSTTPAVSPAQPSQPASSEAPTPTPTPAPESSTEVSVDPTVPRYASPSTDGGGSSSSTDAGASSEVSDGVTGSANRSNSGE